MPSRRATNALTALLVVAAVALVAVAAGFYPAPGPDEGPATATPADDDRPTVTVRDANGTTLATVRVRLADTDEERRVGLSETASLDRGEGMLFVHDGEGRHTYWMRNMSFPLDIVFVDANGTVTAVRHAAVPPEDAALSELRRYRGRGKWVLEVPRGWANETGVDPGDEVVVPEGAT